MRKIYLEYNPYKVETKILVDDVTPKRNSRLQVKDRRLQEWIEDMPEILKEECRDTEYQLTFHGTNPDYEDVEAMATDAEKSAFTFRWSTCRQGKWQIRRPALTGSFRRFRTVPLKN